MKLYHATELEFREGQTITASFTAKSYPDAIAQVQAKIAPQGISRKVALFCADSAEWAAVFADKQNMESPNIYEVKMDAFAHGPFALIFRIHRTLCRSLPVDHLVEEYLNPSKNWKFMEYYGPSCQVVKEAFPDESTGASHMSSYQFTDYDQAQAMVENLT